VTLPRIHVLYEPSTRSAADLAGATAVVIDAIRATTTIVAAFDAGCTEVVPYLTPEEVLAEAARRPAGSVATAGERLGKRIAGLDLNNSPSVMTPDHVGGRSLLLTTTNGTQAILDARRAAEVLIAALSNRRAIARHAVAAGRPVVFVTAGTVGTVSCEDTLVAGAVVEAMIEEAGERFAPEDSAQLALAAWRGIKNDVATAFRRTWGGRATLDLHLDDDLAACCRVDTSRVVPVVRDGARPHIVAA